MAFKFAVVCEARADFHTATELLDRVLCEKVDWIVVEVLDSYREWCGWDDSAPFLLWRDISALARKIGIRAHGHFDGKPGEADAQVSRRALLLLNSLGEALHAILLIRDDDRQTERRLGLEQARANISLPIPVVIGLAHLKRECWVLSGFEPRNAEEQTCLDRLSEDLGFDPRISPDRLADKGDNETRSAKGVLRELTQGDWERQADCWRSTPLRTLEDRGQAVGLSAFLEEIKSRLVPLFTGMNST
jgi:hypothetical protein